MGIDCFAILVAHSGLLWWRIKTTVAGVADWVDSSHPICGSFEVHNQCTFVASCRYLESGEPFYREIQPEEQWLYKNPHRPDTFSAGVTVVSLQK